SLWESKAIGAGNVVAANRGYSFQNLSLPYWSEVYLEFTLVGVVLVFFAYGVFARRLDRAVRGQHAGAAAVLAVICAACRLGLLRGRWGAQVPSLGAGGAFTVGVVALGGRRDSAWGWTRRPDDVDEPFPAPADGRTRVVVLADYWWPEVAG